jgi:hypothetical protein
MSRCLIALVLVSSFSATALAWGPERTPRRADHRHIESTHKHHRPAEPFYKRKSKEALDRDNAAFQREYWDPCNTTLQDYIVFCQP